MVREKATVARVESQPAVLCAAVCRHAGLPLPPPHLHAQPAAPIDRRSYLAIAPLRCRVAPLGSVFANGRLQRQGGFSNWPGRDSLGLLVGAPEEGVRAPVPQQSISRPRKS